MNVDIKEMEILIECKRLVEKMLWEKKFLLDSMDEGDMGYKVVQAHIDRMERALEGKPPLTIKERFGKEN